MKSSFIVICTLLWLFVFTQAAVQPISAQTTLFSDDFSQGLEKWQSLRPDGSHWSIVNGQAEALVTTPGTVTELVPKDQYWDNTWTDFEYQLDYTPIQGADKNISFMVHSLSNWYEIHFIENAYNLVHLADGRVTLNLFEPYVMTNGRTYHLTIHFKKGAIKIWVDGQLIANVVDSTFNQKYGKVGIKAGTGAVTPTRVYFDNIRVTSLPEDTTTLAITPFKQNDPQWGSQIYDTAQTWAPNNPGIQRWGCAMTSLAMIMRFHGINQLPNGQPLNPETLNTWLKAQPDGYIGEGAINWLAGMRLTRLVSEKIGTPKLEYSRENGSSLQTAIAAIKANQPVILEVAGHFFVGNGTTASQNDLATTDPAFTFNTFSKHQKPLLSTRLFKPSFTDLSYLLFAHKSPLNIQLANAQGQIVPLDSFTEQIQAADSDQPLLSPLLYQHQLAKPSNGKYVVSLSQDTLKPFSIQVWAYDQAANATPLHLTGVVGPQPISYTLTYQKTGSSQLQPTVTWEQLKKDIAMLKQSKDIQTFAAIKFETTINQALQLPEVQRARYIQLLNQNLNAYSNVMTPIARQYLQQQFKAVK